MLVGRSCAAVLILTVCASAAGAQRDRMRLPLHPGAAAVVVNALNEPLVSF
jgi:hypothetical protein